MGAANTISKVNYVDAISNMQSRGSIAGIFKEELSPFEFLEEVQQGVNCAVVDVNSGSNYVSDVGNEYFLWRGVHDISTVEYGVLRDATQSEVPCAPLLSSWVFGDGSATVTPATYEPLVQGLCNALIVGENTEPLSVMDMLRLCPTVVTSPMGDDDFGNAAIDCSLSALNGSYMCFDSYSAPLEMRGYAPHYLQLILTVDDDTYTKVVNDVVCGLPPLAQDIRDEDVNNGVNINSQPQLQGVVCDSAFQQMVKLLPEQICWQYTEMEFMPDTANESATRCMMAISRLHDGNVRSDAEITKVHVQLEPASLGRVEVDFCFSKENVGVTIVAERFVTSELLKRHYSEILSHLQFIDFSGVKPELSFSWSGGRHSSFNDGIYKERGDNKVKVGDDCANFGGFGVRGESIFWGGAIVPVSQYKLDIVV